MDALRLPIVVEGRSKRDVGPSEIYSASSAGSLKGGQPHQCPLKQKEKRPQWGPWTGLAFESGGESGIRTRETVSRLHAFQACAFDHSATSPLRAS